MHSWQREENMKRILIVVGTRPNFIKVTQFKKVAQVYPDIDVKIVHTGQHYDAKMADVFFQQFNLEPDFFLNISPGTANSQMSQIMLKLEDVVSTYKPDMMMVVGDVNSTFAAALTANKMNIKIAHLESGLRSNDRSMPEEINRILTDEITDYYFVTEQSGMDNLLKEKKDKSKIFFVGNTMIDTLVAFKKNIMESDVLEKYQLKKGEYVLITMHRPATVDSLEGLEKLLEILEFVSVKYKIVFPIHPRTLEKLGTRGFKEKLTGNKNLIITEPLDYFAFQNLIINSKFILTDSGGIQEESTFYRVPCLTLRPNTERPSTVIIGSNELLTFEMDSVRKKISEIENGVYKKGEIPPLWDGHTSKRIMEVISRL